jgi:hypothetical protein
MADERYARAELPSSITVVDLEPETDPVLPAMLVGFSPSKLEQTLYFPRLVDDVLDDRS